MNVTRCQVSITDTPLTLVSHALVLNGLVSASVMGL